MSLGLCGKIQSLGFWLNYGFILMKTILPKEYTKSVEFFLCSSFLIISIIFVITAAVDYLIVKSSIHLSILEIRLLRFFIMLLLFWLAIKMSFMKYRSCYSMDKTKMTVMFASVVLLSILILICAFVTLDINQGLYYYSKTPHNGWKGRLFQADSLLGYKPIPGSSGFRTFTVGENLPVTFDSNGFRIPSGDRDAVGKKRPLFLFLGCSVTFGDAIRAEEAFPWLVSEKSGGYSINAGVPGYGLAHMLIRARSLIPEYRPDYVVIQYSPWLVGRAMKEYATTYCGTIPVPYISRTETGACTVSEPVFTEIVNQVNIGRYADTPLSILDYYSFLSEISIPLIFYEHYHKTMASLEQRIGKTPVPDNRPGEIEQFVYGTIYELCQKNRCRMIILNIGDMRYTRNSHALVFSGADSVSFAEADLLLIESLESPDDCAREYQIWRFDGKKMVFIDNHPNPKAHRIISEAIVNSLRE